MNPAEQKIKTLLDLRARATQGEWKPQIRRYGGQHISNGMECATVYGTGPECIGHLESAAHVYQATDDAEFIAAAANEITAILESWMVMRKALGRVHAEWVRDHSENRVWPGYPYFAVSGAFAEADALILGTKDAASGGEGEG